MATSIETSHHYPFAASKVHDALLDKDYLRAKLANLGGTNAELVAYESRPDGSTKIVLRQGVPADKLPSFVRSLISGDLVITRTEVWRSADNGGASGTVQASIAQAPASIEGAQRLSTDGDGAARISGTLSVKVSIPLVGGKVEKVIVEQLRQLLDSEFEFTLGWLREHSGA